MVNPITSHVGVIPISPISADTGRSNSDRPQPAVKVTAAAETGAMRDQSGSATEDERPVEKALEALNASMQAWSTGLRFEVDDEAQRIVVSIVDRQSGEVLRTIPSEAVIRIAKRIVQLQGNNINTRA